MKNIAGWVGASAIITVLWGACTVTTDDNGGAGHAGTGGSSTGTGGSSTGTGGTSSTGGAGGGATGGSAGAPTDARADTAPPSACQACGETNCAAETTACKQDTAGCGRVYQDFYDCISMTQSIDDCALMFVIEINQVDGGASRLDALATCLKEPACEQICLTAPDGG